MHPALQFLRKYFLELFFGLILILSFTFNKDGRVLRADGKGYYGYLPAIFIYHDPSYSFIDLYEKRYYPENMYADFTNRTEEGKRVNKYFIGVAILQLPFFLAAHVLAILFGLTADGYSPWYQFWFMGGGVFYLYMGFRWLLNALRYFSPNEWINRLSLAAVLLGTNLYHYGLAEHCMSHIYSLSMVSLFLLGLLRIFRDRNSRWIPVTALALGMIVAIRPVNILIIGILPFAAGSMAGLGSGLRFIFTRYKQLILAVLACAAPIVLQCLAWYWQTGHFIVYSYGEEGFNFKEPHIPEILFSYRKGWFLWSPLAFLGIIGYWVAVRRGVFRAVSMTGFLLVVAYVLSCWWTWSYGMSFGARAFLEFLFLVPIGLALFWGTLKRKSLKIAFSLICIFLIYVNQVQAYQYRHFIIKWDGMTGHYYWMVFLKTGHEWDGKIWGDENAPPPPPDTVMVAGKPVLTVKNDYENGDIWGANEAVTEAAAYLGKKGFRMSGKQDYSSAYITHMEGRNDSAVQVTLWYRGKGVDDAALCMLIGDKGESLVWQETRLQPAENDQWTRALLKHRFTERELQKGNELRVFVWNKNKKGTLDLDDFRIEYFPETSDNSSTR